jgi:hypothetical protein
VGMRLRIADRHQAAYAVTGKTRLLGQH